MDQRAPRQPSRLCAEDPFLICPHETLLPTCSATEICIHPLPRCLFNIVNLQFCGTVVSVYAVAAEPNSLRLRFLPHNTFLFSLINSLIATCLLFFETMVSFHKRSTDLLLPLRERLRVFRAVPPGVQVHSVSLKPPSCSHQLPTDLEFSGLRSLGSLPSVLGQHLLSGPLSSCFVTHFFCLSAISSHLLREPLDV